MPFHGQFFFFPLQTHPLLAEHSFFLHLTIAVPIISPMGVVFLQKSQTSSNFQLTFVGKSSTRLKSVQTAIGE
jgi:hypothetical protein